MWEDLVQQSWEATGATENPQSMKYYTPFGDLYSDFFDKDESFELGAREVFFRRPNMPRNNSAEMK